MPKAALPTLPVSGLFGVTKPSGSTSMSIVSIVQELLVKSRLFVEPEKLAKSKGKAPKGRQARQIIKVGQGGTLDPLADGVLVMGVGKGTKKLSTFLDCEKEYRTTCLLGCETDSYDSQGAVVRKAPWKHVTREQVESNLAQFRGKIQQTPPIFSALKMDGMPLYDYARKGIPLPRPIEARPVTISELEITEWLGNDHSFSYPSKELSEDEKKALAKAIHSVDKDAPLDSNPETDSPEDRPTAFVLTMKVSGGTYVRSIVHDLAHAVGSAGHVVTLTRSRQGRFVLNPTEDDDRGCVPWHVFEKASADPGEVGEDGWTEWEREVIERLEVV